MKMISRSKILSTILVLSLILSAILPTGIVSQAAAGDVVTKPDYSNLLRDVSAMDADGWKASYSRDPQNGTPFVYEESSKGTISKIGDILKHGAARLLLAVSNREYIMTHVLPKRLLIAWAPLLIPNRSTSTLP